MRSAPLVPARHPPLGVEQENRVVLDALDHRAEALLALGHQRLHAPPLRHVLLQLLVGERELPCALGDANLELVAVLAYRLHDAIALAQDRAQHETRRDRGAVEGEQHEQRLVDGGHAVGALEHVPHREGARRGSGRGDLALAEAECRPHDERDDQEHERGKGRGTGVEPVGDLRDEEQQHRERNRFRVSSASTRRPGSAWPR